MSADILKVFSHFKALHKTSLALVEISPMMSDLQAKKLCTNSFVCSDQSVVYRKGKNCLKTFAERNTDITDV